MGPFLGQDKLLVAVTAIWRAHTGITGQDTLHGGIYGWDRRNWTIVTKSPTSVTYHHLDAADEGFPGNVSAYVRPGFDFMFVFADVL